MKKIIDKGLSKKKALYRDFILQLRKSQFIGDIEDKQAELLLKSLDNSIYQMMPLMVVYPKSKEDLQCFLECFNQQRFAEITVTVRGGGTSTMGQSLSQDCVVDLSRYLNNIKELQLDNDEIVVESGVVLSDLVAYLKPYNKDFAINISSSSAATIGGMVNTDASGSNSLTVNILDAFALSYSPEIIVSFINLLKKMKLLYCIIPFSSSGIAANNVDGCCYGREGFKGIIRASRGD